MAFQVILEPIWLEPTLKATLYIFNFRFTEVSLVMVLPVQDFFRLDSFRRFASHRHMRVYQSSQSLSPNQVARGQKSQQFISSEFLLLIKFPLKAA